VNYLTVEDLKPGVLYRVVDPGDADPQFSGAVVLGVGRAYNAVAVTIWLPDDGASGWLGANWWSLDRRPEDQDPDTAARFVELPYRLNLTVGALSARS
jgi:hypothetical protein